jgi:multidrug resistance efflux pump
MPAQLKCSESTQVLNIVVANQAKVHAGDLLMTLDDSRWQKLLATLKEKQATLTAQLTLVSNDQIKKRGDFLDQASASFDEMLKEILNFHFAEKDAYSMGKIDWNQLMQAQQRQWTAEETQSQAAVNAEQLKRDADIARRYIERAIKFISTEQQYAQTRINRLSVKAPISGTISLFVGEHTPVRCGFVLAEIK